MTDTSTIRPSYLPGRLSQVFDGHHPSWTLTDAQAVRLLLAERDRASIYRDVAISQETRRWLVVAAAYLRQMSEIERLHAERASGAAIVDALDRALGLPDPDATLECASKLEDIVFAWNLTEATEIEAPIASRKA